MSEILFQISKISMAVGAANAVLAVFFFFRFHLPTVFDELSGRGMRKRMEKERQKRDRQRKLPVQQALPSVRPIEEIPKEQMEDLAETDLIQEASARTLR